MIILKNWILSVFSVLNNKGFIYHDQYYQRHRSPKINDPINDQTISEIKSQEPLLARFRIGFWPKHNHGWENHKKDC